MTTRTYGQFCGLARALELIGERWAPLVLRDLVLGPKKFTELRRGLPKIPASILSARLNELEQGGVVRRRVEPAPDASVVYELTEYGAELEPVLLQLGLWGARSLGGPGPEDVFTLDSAILSLYTTFRGDHASGVRVVYELHYPDMVVHAVVDDGELRVGSGSHPDADLILQPRGPVMLDVLTGGLSPADAVATGAVGITGPFEKFELFTDLFHIPSAPAPAEGLALR
ncbi:winged helix-turn-helix transcriptional regulator [Saccharothrix hoggarensis]|uniref:Winged helix-turn-helix transcriptional regulator n=1 Tax=Saccharothrix hoggarensis TaxID=913853 RepID=A0ABW3R1W1_9PSEU